ncbi:MAG: hypothetical protein NZ899_10235 [Thermoguttaceae bacterium]|nr:hypothetical protein [Thermoguttaceae bacterium]MDW8078064.1 hypothetical protein [Thermoguttaceae bacterium]
MGSSGRGRLDPLALFLHPRSGRAWPWGASPSIGGILLPPLTMRLITGLMAAVFAGCSALPRRYEQVTVYNPFPELCRVAVVPFFNHSKEPTVNGAEFARAYYLELQSVPGFEVVPVEVVTRALQEHRLQLRHPGEVRRLAEILDVDAVVIGVVTDYQPYYPPRCGLHVEWYARDPSARPIPPGFGIHWGSRRARKMPDSLKLEAAIAWARERLRHDPMPASGLDPHLRSEYRPGSAEVSAPPEDVPVFLLPSDQGGGGAPAASTGAFQTGPSLAQAEPQTPSTSDGTASTTAETIEPIMVHTRVFTGNDPEFARALANYYEFREDARFGGWQGYLERSEDFIRFCCRLHIHQMLVARGGSGKKQVRWDWPLFR